MQQDEVIPYSQFMKGVDPSEDTNLLQTNKLADLTELSFLATNI